MSIIGQRMSEVMNERGMKLTKLEESTGVSRGNLSRYISGKVIPRGETVHKISKALDVDEQWLLGLSDIRKAPKVQVNKNWFDIPIYSELDKEPTDHLALPFSIMFTGQAFAHFIEDDSMEPEFHKGDLLIFQEAAEIKSGEIGFFNLNGIPYCRRLKKLPDGNYWLLSDNPKYDPIIVKPEDKFETLGLYQLKITK